MKLNNNDASQFPKLARYLRDEFPAVLKKSPIQKGLESAGIGYKDAVIYTTYGYDPAVDVKPIPGTDMMGWEVTSKWKGTAQTYGIQISTGVVKAFNKGEDLTTFTVAGNIHLLDATLLIMLVAWRKLAETGGVISQEELVTEVRSFQKKAIGDAQAILNPFL